MEKKKVKKEKLVPCSLCGQGVVENSHISEVKYGVPVFEFPSFKGVARKFISSSKDYSTYGVTFMTYEDAEKILENSLQSSRMTSDEHGRYKTAVEVLQYGIDNGYVHGCFVFLASTEGIGIADEEDIETNGPIYFMSLEKALTILLTTKFNKKRLSHSDLHRLLTAYLVVKEYKKLELVKKHIPSFHEMLCLYYKGWRYDDPIISACLSCFEWPEHLFAVINSRCRLTGKVVSSVDYHDAVIQGKFILKLKA